MPKESRRRFDPEFREGAVRVWRETGKPIAQVARDLGINEGTLGNWIARDQAARDGADGLSREDMAELKRLRAEVAELRMERDILCCCPRPPWIRAQHAISRRRSPRTEPASRAATICPTVKHWDRRSSSRFT